MSIHIDPDTGSPVFILDQMMMVDELRAVYHRYGIHGIYYAVLFCWAGSPFASLTDQAERHEAVCRQVYRSVYYDPIKQDDVRRERLRSPRQYEQEDMVAAFRRISELARVPVLEEKLLYLGMLDRIKVALSVEFNPLDFKKAKEATEVQKNLLANSKAVSAALKEAMETERTMLLKHDPKASLDDFILKVTV
ncbi:hypothetical protein [Dyadobacter sp. BHUBP1]|uniref:hypothetical protein n=1 Tax=Dyadobacter sp. BHUBP1 TaxID=3424178 RepID=UPI003D331B9C